MKYLLKKDLPTIKAGTEFEYKHNILTGSYWVELVKWDTIGWLLDFINGFGIDNDFFEPIPESKVWKPKRWDKYSTVHSDGTVNSCNWYNHGEDNIRFKMWNIYKTEEEAIKARDKQLAIVRLKNYIIENWIWMNDKDVAEWRCNISIQYHDWEFIAHASHSISYSPFWYLQSFDCAKQFIKDCEKDLLLIYLH